MMTNVSNNHLYITLLSILFLSLFGVYIDDNISMLLLTLMLLIMGVIFSYIINMQGDIKNSIYIFLLFFAIYMCYNFMVHMGLIYIYGVENIKADEKWFFSASNDVELRLRYGYTFFEVADIQNYGDTSGAVYLYGVIATLANIYGENSVLVQKVAVAFVASLIPMTMYGISSLYLSQRASLNVAIIYGLFSFVPFLSSTLLRDAHIALMFILTMYIILQKWSFLRFILLLLISFYSYFLREQTGIFMMGFTSIYFFLFVQKRVKNRYMQVSIYLTIILVAIAFVLNSSFLMDMFMQISQGSASRSEASASSGSMGAKIAKLPFGLNVVTLFSFGQMQPFPPSLIFSSSHKGILEFPFLMAGISWFLGWGFLLYGIFKKRVLQNLDLQLLLMFVFSILYVVLISVVEFSQRRQMAVYPIIFLVMVMSYLEIPKKMKSRIWIVMSLFYITLVLVINFIKI